MPCEILVLVGDLPALVGERRGGSSCSAWTESGDTTLMLPGDWTRMLADGLPRPWQGRPMWRPRPLLELNEEGEADAGRTWVLRGEAVWLSAGEARGSGTGAGAAAEPRSPAAGSMMRTLRLEKRDLRPLES